LLYPSCHGKLNTPKDEEERSLKISGLLEEMGIPEGIRKDTLSVCE